MKTFEEFKITENESSNKEEVDIMISIRDLLQGIKDDLDIELDNLNQSPLQVTHHELGERYQLYQLKMHVAQLSYEVSRLSNTIWFIEP